MLLNALFFLGGRVSTYAIRWYRYTLTDSSWLLRNDDVGCLPSVVRGLLTVIGLNRNEMRELLYTVSELT